VAIILVVVAVVWTSGRATNSPLASPPPRPAAPAAQGRGSAPDAPEHVKLEALKLPRGEPADATRNPFQFEAARTAAPKPLGGESLPPNPVNETPAMVAPPVPVVPPPPPIPLKFIGIVTQGPKRLAVLTDGRSTPQSGEEGAIILGQYRILKIGNESIEMAYLDGRGRQTIRLTGQ
jgi:hypothetical protein